MEQKTQDARIKAKAERQAEARRHTIFGVVAAVVVVGLIAMIFIIDYYGQSRMANVSVQTRDAADR